MGWIMGLRFEKGWEYGLSWVMMMGLGWDMMVVLATLRHLGFFGCCSISTAGWRMMGGLLHLILGVGAEALGYGVVVEDHNVYVWGDSWSLTLVSWLSWLYYRRVGPGFGRESRRLARSMNGIECLYYPTMYRLFPTSYLVEVHVPTYLVGIGYLSLSRQSGACEV